MKTHIMDVPVNGARESSSSRAFVFLLSAMLAGQALGTMATMTLPAVAPAVAASYGVPSSLIGYQISLLAAAMLIALAFGGNLSTRWGACRVQQVALTLLVAGCVIATGPGVAFFFASAVSLGLGYGLLTPSASHLLMRFTPEARRNLLFSVKQTGVPVGGILSAMIAPAVAGRFGWRWSLALVAVLMAGLIVLLQSRRRDWDDDRQPAAPMFHNPLEGIATIWRNRRLRYLSVAGACLVVPQIGISTFTVVFFAEEIGYTLVAAGIVLGASQLAGVVGRIFWGWLADLMRNCYTVLSILSAVMLAAALLCFAIAPGWPLVFAYALFFVFGSTATGWSGAFLAEVARVAPPHAISRATGGSLFFVNVGKLLGPILMANAYAVSGSYAITFGLLSVLAAASLACLLAARA
ncbi:MAG: MFS transporter [Burkholderiales bacterium]